MKARSVRTILVVFIVYSMLSAGLSSLVYQNVFEAELRLLKQAGTIRLNGAASLFRQQIDGYRALINVMAQDAKITRAFETGQYAKLGDVLIDYKVTYGFGRVGVTDRDGVIRASSVNEGLGRRVPRALITAALNNRLGFKQSVLEGERFIQLSRAIRIDGQDPVGTVVVSIALTPLEHEWSFTTEPIVFFDAERLSFSANRSDLLLLSRGGDPEQAHFDLAPIGRVDEETLWRFVPPAGPPRTVLIVSRYIPNLDLTAEIYLDTAAARSTAWLRAVLVLAAAGIVFLMGAVAIQQRRRLATEAGHSAELERRVEDRTEALRAAQGKLVEASKLAALGRLSAGVSHELNQPLAAILNFAENGQNLLLRGRSDTAAQNLTLISDQVHRITRIIGNLRAFARQEVAPTDLVDFVEVVEAALVLASTDIDTAKVALDRRLPPEPLMVLAGQVRLEQVVLNLISNALDAMVDVPAKSLSVHLCRQGSDAVLMVADSGHGISEPSRVFEPFYTTKELGASKGLGMGLALSHGIITRFGGTLSCRNLERGAEFTLKLPLSEADDA